MTCRRSHDSTKIAGTALGLKQTEGLFLLQVQTVLIKWVVFFWHFCQLPLKTILKHCIITTPPIQFDLAYRDTFMGLNVYFTCTCKNTPSPFGNQIYLTFLVRQCS